MIALSAVDLAKMTVTATDGSLVVLDLTNSGNSLRWSEAFPSLTGDQLAMLDEVTFLQFGSWREAVDTFQRLTLDASQNGVGSLIAGTITLACRPFNEDDGVETWAWEFGDDSRPVFRDCRWSYEDIVL